jgi:hypothetical protein
MTQRGEFESFIVGKIFSHSLASITYFCCYRPLTPCYFIRYSLVCLIAPDSRDNPSSPEPWSVNMAARTLQSYESQDKVMRHYLEPSPRAPKRFVAEKPDSAGEDWAESLLKIRRVGPVCALVGNAPGQALSRALWRQDGTIPHNCSAVLELEIELLTGRTHQIRGQLSAFGFPLVGDAQYGGLRMDGLKNDYSLSDRLALQCSKLDFLEPEQVKTKDGSLSMTRTGRWKTFELPTSWWSPILDEYEGQSKNVSPVEATTLAADMDLTRPKAAAPAKVLRPDLLPERVALSTGKNKYVLICASHPTTDKDEWFVKSAAPQECGGPYHGNVAQDLREWIQAAGYNVKVTGGGRIDYDPEQGTAVVYGFSYGFGKGDHAQAAALIQEWYKGQISASFDDSDGLY